MPQRIASLQLPAARTETARETNRQLMLWASQVVSVVNSLSADPGLSNSGNPGSAVTTISFSGTKAAINTAALMQFVAGGESLATINPPRGFSGAFFLIAQNSFSLVSGGNIIIPGGAAALRSGEMVPLVFDGKDWYASIPVSSNFVSVKIVTHDLSPYTVQDNDYFMLALAGTDADTLILLPPATGSGRPLDVKKIDSNPYNIGVIPAGGDTVDDSPGAFNILARYGSFTLVDYAAGKWAIL